MNLKSEKLLIIETGGSIILLVKGRPINVCQIQYRNEISHQGYRSDSINMKMFLRAPNLQNQ